MAKKLLVRLDPGPVGLKPHHAVLDDDPVLEVLVDGGPQRDGRQCASNEKDDRPGGLRSRVVRVSDLSQTTERREALEPGHGVLAPDHQVALDRHDAKRK